MCKSFPTYVNRHQLGHPNLCARDMKLRYLSLGIVQPSSHVQMSGTLLGSLSGTGPGHPFPFSCGSSVGQVIIYEREFKEGTCLSLQGYLPLSFSLCTL